MMLTLVKPAFDDLWFRKNLMADEETMSYNARWGGTIPFPEEEWESWYESWVRNPGASRYYRYLMNSEIFISVMLLFSLNIVIADMELTHCSNYA